jgi:hypothetical protein
MTAPAVLATRRPRAAAVLAATALAGTLAAAPAATATSPASKPAGSCARHAPGALLATKAVVVFARPTAERDGRRVYACRRPGGTATLVGLDLADEELYGSDSIVSDVRAAGIYVSAQITRGRASLSQCSKYTPGPDCPRPSTAVRVVDTRSGRAGELPATGEVGAVALSPAGAVAWTQSGVLVGTGLAPFGRHRLAGAPRELDRGAITGLRFTGTTLLWRSAGVPHRQDLGA